MRIVTAGHVVIDEVLDHAESQLPRLALGGAASYSSTCLSSLGYECVVVTKFGSDFPREYRDFLTKNANALLDQCEVYGAKTTRYRIDRRIPGGGRTLFLESKSPDLSADDFSNIFREDPKSQILIANSVAGEISPDLLGKLVVKFDRVLVDSQGFVRIIDPISGGGVKLTNGGLDLSMLNGVNVLKADADELFAWTGSRDKNSAIAELSKHVRSILLTGGAGPVDFYEGGVLRLRATPFKVAPLDTTGAGDIFLAIFAARLAETRDTVDALRFAISAATLSVRTLGIEKAILSRKEIIESSGSVLVSEFSA